MKTLPKYLKPDAMVTLRCGKTSRTVTAKEAVQAGAGDCTVQEDGKTVHVTVSHLARLPQR